MISIHAPLTGSDLESARQVRANGHFNPRSPYGERQLPRHCSICGSTFQSTLPLRGATIYRGLRRGAFGISIHAPLTGSDAKRIRRKTILTNFNPRSPYGERLYSSSKCSAKSTNFNPRSPYGERLDLYPAQLKIRFISIHAPLTGSDVPLPYQLLGQLAISIHAPLTGSDGTLRRSGGLSRDFNPRSPYGERPRNF